MKTFKLLVRYMKKYWILLILTVLLLVFLNYVRSIIPKLTSEFIAIIDPTAESEVPFYLKRFYSGDTPQKLLTTMILIMGIGLIRETINIIVDVNIFRLSEVVGCKAQIDYFKKVQNLTYSYLNHSETGDLIQRSTSDINRFKEFIANICPCFLIVILNSIKELATRHTESIHLHFFSSFHGVNNC